MIGALRVETETVTGSIVRCPQGDGKDRHWRRRSARTRPADDRVARRQRFAKRRSWARPLVEGPGSPLPVKFALSPTPDDAVYCGAAHGPRLLTRSIIFSTHCATATLIHTHFESEHQKEAYCSWKVFDDKDP